MKQLYIDGELVGNTAELTPYTDPTTGTATNVKQALDTLMAGEGGSGQTEPVMLVCGSSSATDAPFSTSQGITEYHSVASVFKVLSQKLNVKRGNYLNIAGHGNVITNLNNYLNTIPVATNLVFIMFGGNEFKTAGPTRPLGDVTTVMSYADGAAELESSFAGLYRKAVDTIKARCGIGCKVYFVSQLYGSKDNDADIKVTYNEWRKVQYELYMAMNEATVNGEKKYNVGYIRGPLMGLRADNASKYSDGQHPNEEGARMIAEHMMCEMNGNLLDAPIWSCSTTGVTLTASAVGETVSGTFIFNAIGDFLPSNKLRLAVTSRSASSAVINAFTVTPTEIDMCAGKVVDVPITITYTPIDTSEHTLYLKFNGSDNGMLKVVGKVADND